MRFLTSCLLVLAVPALASDQATADVPADVIFTPAPERLDFDVEQRLEPGLIVAFTQAIDGPQADARTARLAAIFMLSDEPPTPFLQPGPFTAVFRGYLFLDLSGSYTFHLAGRGKVALRIQGQEVLRGPGDLAKLDPVTVEMHRDYTPIELLYESPQDATAELRLLWEGRKEHFGEDNAFAREPLPPSMVWHDPADPALAAPLSLRRGRELFANLNCIQCHTLSEMALAGGRSMPEMARKNPDLAGVGARLDPAWLYQWIANPAALRNHFTMPQVFGSEVDPAEQQELVHLVAYLRSLTGNGTPEPEDAAHVDGDAADLVRAGEILYEDLGCIACHRFTPPADEDFYERTSLHAAGAKYRPGALAAFLQAPHAHYSHSRMPDFRLSLEEAASLAAFIRARSSWEPDEADAVQSGDPVKGKAVFAARRCGACHDVGDEGIPPARVPLKVDGKQIAGCLAEAGAQRGTAPEFPVSSDDLNALRAFLSAGKPAIESLDRHVPVEASERLVAGLRCTACHGRDGQFSALSEVVLEEGVQGLPPGNIPSLTWAGEKLQREWIGKLLEGRLDYRARPWLKARMPAFPAYAEPLAAGLTRAHGYSGAVRPRPKPEEDLAAIGEKLIDQFTGFYCTECHSAGGRPPTSAFDHRGIDFPYVAERLQYDYYHRWMRDPQRIDPGTKMPQFAKQPKPEILGGDAERQFDAIWHFLQSHQGRTVP